MNVRVAALLVLSVIFSVFPTLCRAETAGVDAETDGMFKVTLVDNGVSFEKEVSGLLELPAASISGFSCKKEKWAFAGWTADAGFSTPYRAPKLEGAQFLPTSDTTLYAVYRLPADSLQVSAANGLPVGWTFTGDKVMADEWWLRDGDFLITDRVDIQRIESIKINHKSSSSNDKMRFLVSDNNAPDNTGDKSVFVEVKCVKTEFGTVETVANETDTDSGYIKIYPSFAVTSKRLDIKGITFKYRNKYSLQPECTYVPRQCTVALMNADTLYRSAVLSDGEPFPFPDEAIAVSKGCSREGWKFLGWSARRIADEMVLPDMVDTSSFAFHSDTTLYSLFSLYDYDKTDVSPDTQMVVLGALTPEGCFVMRSDMKTIEYDKPAVVKTFGTAQPLPHSEPIVAADDDGGMVWLMCNLSGKYTLTDGKRSLGRGGEDADKLVYQQGGYYSFWIPVANTSGGYYVADYNNNSRILCFDASEKCFSVKRRDAVEGSAAVYPVTIIPVCNDYYTSKPYCVTALAPSEKLIVDGSGLDTYATDELRLSLSSDAVCQVEHNVPVEVANGATVSLFMGDAGSRLFGLPFDCNVADIVVTADGDTLDINTGWFLSECRTAAELDETNIPVLWERNDNLSALSRGVGYIITVISDSKNVVASFVSSEKELVFSPYRQTVAAEERRAEPAADERLAGWGVYTTPYLYSFNKGVVSASGKAIDFVSIPAVDGRLVQHNMQKAIDSGILTPYTPILIQKPVGAELEFDPSGQTGADETPRLDIAVATDGKATDVATLRHSDLSTPLYEAGPDMLKFIDTTAVNVYTTDNSHRYYVNTRPVSLPQSIHFGVFLPQRQNLRISVDVVHDSLFGKVKLLDKATGAEVDIAGSEYVAEVGPGFTDNRFVLELSSGTSTDNVVIPAAAPCQSVVTTGSGVVVYGVAANTAVVVFDITGKPVFSTTATGGSVVIPLAAKGVYVLCLVDTGGVRTTAKIVF